MTAQERFGAMLAQADMTDPWMAFRWARYALAARVLSGAVLDLGCELGMGARLVAQSTTSVVAVDNRSDHLAVARTLLAGSAAVVVQADGRRLPFHDAAFDGICLFNVLSVAERPDEVLAECWRVLSPQGLLLLSDAQCVHGVTRSVPGALHPGIDAAWRLVGVHLRDGHARATSPRAGDRWWIALGSPDPGRPETVCRAMHGVTLDLAETAGRDRPQTA